MVTVVKPNAGDVRVWDLPLPVWALVAARAVNRLGAFSLAFLTTLLVVELGADLEQAGLVAAAFGLATIPSRLAGGVLADRVGRVPTMVGGLVACAAAQLLLAAAPGLPVAVVGAVALGLAFELYEPPSQALVADLTDEAQRPVAYGLLGAALAAAGALAGLLAAAVGGLGLRWLMVADAATCLAAAVLVALVVRAPARRAEPTPAAATSPWRDRRLLALLGCGTVFATAYMGLVGGLPLTLVARGIAPERAGLLLTASAVVVVVGQPLLGRLGRPWLADPFTALAAGYTGIAAGTALLAVATGPVGLAASTVLWSLGDLLVLGHAFALVASVAPAASRASYLAVFGLSWGVATTLAPLLVTRLLDAGGPAGLWLPVSGAMLALALVQPRLRRTVRPA